MTLIIRYVVKYFFPGLILLALTLLSFSLFSLGFLSADKTDYPPSKSRLHWKLKKHAGIEIEKYLMASSCVRCYKAFFMGKQIAFNLIHAPSFVWRPLTL